MELSELLSALEGMKAKQAEAVGVVRAALDVEIAELKGKLEELTAKEVDGDVALKSDLEDVARKSDLEDIIAKMQAPGFISGMGEPEVSIERKSFDEFVRKGEDRMMEYKAADLQASTDASGGFSVPEELRREIIRIENEMSPMRSVCDVRSAGTSDVKQLVAHGAAASGWVGETAARTQTTTPDLAQRTAVFGEVYAMPRAYQHMLEDSFFDAEAWLAEEVGRQFAEVSGTAFLSGDGSDKPVGILDGITVAADAAVNDATGVYQVIDTGVDNALGATDIASAEFLRQQVIPALRTGYRSGARWMMNEQTYAEIATWKDANDQFYLNPDISQASATSLFGFPITINWDMENIDEAADSFPIIFGDFRRAFQIIDRTGVSVLRDPYTSKGSVQFYTRKRVGSMKLDANAIKVVSVNHV